MVPQKFTHSAISLRSGSCCHTAVITLPSTCRPVTDQLPVTEDTFLSPFSVGLYVEPFLCLSNTNNFKSAGSRSREMVLLSSFNLFRSPVSASHSHVCIRELKNDGVIFISYPAFMFELISTITSESFDSYLTCVMNLFGESILT